MAGISAGSTASAGVSNVLVLVDNVPALCSHRPLWEALSGVVHSALGTNDRWGEAFKRLALRRLDWLVPTRSATIVVDMELLAKLDHLGK